MNRELEELLAALAVGALTPAEASRLAGQLAADPHLRAAYRGYPDAAQCVALSARPATSQLKADRKKRMFARILSSATAAGAQTRTGYDALVPHDRMLQYADGVQWAVIPSDGITIVYFRFDPARCPVVPLESHEQIECGYVMQGACTLFGADGSGQRFQTGDYYRVEPGVQHGAIIHARTVLCDVFAPRNLTLERRYASQLAALS